MVACAWHSKSELGMDIDRSLDIKYHASIDER